MILRAHEMCVFFVAPKVIPLGSWRGKIPILTFRVFRWVGSTTNQLHQPPTSYTPGSTNIAGWKMDPLIESLYFLLKMGKYVSLPEFTRLSCFLGVVFLVSSEAQMALRRRRVPETSLKVWAWPGMGFDVSLVC